MKRGTLRLATRGSDLALRQTASVRDTLADRRFDVELVEVETRGDQIRDELLHRLGKTGAFVRALDERVLDEEVDAAVHSMKDMPTEHPRDLVVAGVPERAPANDVLLTPDGTAFENLPAGSVVGTSSLRRKAQILSARPDLEVEPLRGNVDTRVEKLLAPTLQREHEARIDDDSDKKANSAEASASGEEYETDFDRTIEEWFDDLSEIERRSLERDVETEYDAIVLAEAGLKRSGLLHRVEYDRLPPTEFVPAPGQGAIAVTARRDHENLDRIQDALDDPRTRVTTTVERTVLAELGGGCIAPIGVHAKLQGEHVHVTARVLSTDGEEEVSDSRNLPVHNHANAAAEFAESLASQGAADLISEARDDARDEEDEK
ncbi:hydroxymethylbilane synthase [Halogeometricum borinquense]|uniref:Hydroxymethylbilane synthase n=1 Tax=Halogeometricum borinquense TaxID=60847 RepID=A0A6C0UC62_9EURY|nr:hydroxymethylbilane synthase [Halogeometricum borinquense]QIB72852.1 hydroxymethylbilane synthase [Halogeometricum borinquense]QIQ75191.1 hydroxymethylbilane synthase [Halogeometricum borinquense]